MKYILIILTLFLLSCNTKKKLAETSSGVETVTSSGATTTTTVIDTTSNLLVLVETTVTDYTSRDEVNQQTGEKHPVIIPVRVVTQRKVFQREQRGLSYDEHTTDISNGRTVVTEHARVKESDKPPNIQLYVILAFVGLIVGYVVYRKISVFF